MGLFSAKSSSLPQIGCLLLIAVVHHVQPHGRLIEPPSRSTMWRYGFNTPPNYNDHELYCGGFSRQWGTNGGKCGICGDPWDMKLPRPNEAGGLYGKGIIVRKYEKNAVIKVRVELTANHMGYFEFRVCPNNNLLKPATQKCLDLYKLRSANGGGSRYHPGPGVRVFEMQYKLPEDLTCRQCVFQWRYVAGNNWGTCPNGTESVGCGPQEEFRACADITITEQDGAADSSPNTHMDDDTYVPSDESSDEYNEIDTDDVDTKNYEKNLQKEEVVVESFIFVVLASILFTVLFFGCLFVCYTRRSCPNFTLDHEWPSVEFAFPSLPKKLPTVSMPTAIKNVTSHINWPLHNIQIKSFPAVVQKASVNIHANSVQSPVEQPAQPRPPPRAKRPVSSQATAIRVANGALRQKPTHPKMAPPPPPPAVPATPTQIAVLEIGSPIEVTINGVSVSQKRASSCLVPAQPALASEDIPDSMEPHVDSMCVVPPPLPQSPPPDF